MSKWLTPGVLKEIQRLEMPRRNIYLSKSLTKEEVTNLNLANQIISLRRSSIFDRGDTFVYDLHSKFIFGKFKNNELRQVWKVAPEYIEWCMIYADGFIVEPDALEKVQSEPIIQYDFLNTLLLGTDSQITIDLTPFPLNANGFRVCPKEVAYKLSDEALDSNKEKLAVETHPLTVVKGSQWGDNKAVTKLPRRLSFVIRG